MPRDWLALYLEEDLGPGDITANALFTPDRQGKARIVAREKLFLAGSGHAIELFRRLGAKATGHPDGRWVAAGDTILDVAGPTRAILSVERVALNLISRMSGIASLTRELAEALGKACCPAIVTATRKTTPGFRAFEKEAVQVGGGDPHRMGLWDAAMVKDNHIAACGGDVAVAVRKVVAANPGKVVTCEVESLAQAMAAAEAGAQWLLIDNQSPATGKEWAEAVWAKFPRMRIEASGGIRPENILDYGWADRVSLGWLTQKAAGKDVSLEWQP